MIGRISTIARRGALLVALAAALPASAGGDVVYIEDGDGGERAYLGVSLEEETKDPEGGARITQVLEGSPAEKAGLEEDDVIQRFAGKRIRGPVSLTEQLQEKKPGERVSITVMRDGKQQEIDVELGERDGVWSLRRGKVMGVPLDPEDLEELEDLGEHFRGQWQDGEFEHLAPRAFAFGFGRPKLGVELAETTPELRRHFGGSDEAGVLIAKVLPDMPAAEAGLEVGDLIVAVDGEPVGSADELREMLASQDGAVLKIEVVRDKRRQTIEVTLPEAEKRERPSGPRAQLRMLAPPRPPAAPTPVATPAPPAPPAAPAPPAPSFARREVRLWV